MCLMQCGFFFYQLPLRGPSRLKWWRWRNLTRGIFTSDSRPGSSEIWQRWMPKMPARSENDCIPSTFSLSVTHNNALWWWTHFFPLIHSMLLFSFRRILNSTFISRRCTGGWPAARLKKTPSFLAFGSWTSVIWGRRWSLWMSVLSCWKVWKLSILNHPCERMPLFMIWLPLLKGVSLTLVFIGCVWSTLI